MLVNSESPWPSRRNPLWDGFASYAEERPAIQAPQEDSDISTFGGSGRAAVCFRMETTPPTGSGKRSQTLGWSLEPPWSRSSPMLGSHLGQALPSRSSQTDTSVGTGAWREHWGDPESSRSHIFSHVAPLEFSALVVIGWSPRGPSPRAGVRTTLQG